MYLKKEFNVSDFMGKFTERFTDAQERAILSIFFTNPFGNVSFVKGGADFGPEEQAALAAKYSRSDKPYQEKFLEQVAKDKSLDMDFINQLVVDPSAMARFSIGSSSLRKDTTRFHTQWSLGFSPEEKDQAIRGFGDGSIKDSANALYHAERITDNDNKIITQNPRDRPQVASTRYIDFSKELANVESNPDIQGSKYASEILSMVQKLSTAYLRFTDICADYVAAHALNQEFREKVWLSSDALEKDLGHWKAKELQKDPERTFDESETVLQRERIIAKKEKEYQGYARKTVLDSTRYLLFPAITTSMAVSTDANTLETDITNLLSAPLRSAQKLGTEILTEGRKVMPTLLGDKTHAKRSDFIVNIREKLTDYVRTQIPQEKDRAFTTTPRVNYIDQRVASYTDAAQAAAIVFPYSHCSFEQLYHHFSKNANHVGVIVDVLLQLRNKFDQDPPELLHGGLMRENLVDYGAYRDIQRHRRGFKSRQLLSTYHGYETPELLTMAGLKSEFDGLMNEVDLLYRKIESDNPHVAQLMVPFAYKLRTLYSWQFGQDLFFAKLRSGEGGHPSYRAVAWDMEDACKDRMPEFSRLFRVDRTSYPAELINLKEARGWYNQHKRS